MKYRNDVLARLNSLHINIKNIKSALEKNNPPVSLDQMARALETYEVAIQDIMDKVEREPDDFSMVNR